MERLFSDAELGYLPLGFQFFVKQPEQKEQIKPEFQEKEKFVEINYYNTNKYIVHTHYKPISKIMKVKHE